MNEEEHIKENLRIANEALPNSLTEEELELIKKARDKYRELMKIGCTGCGYCMPCPAGVNIARCFETYDSIHTFGDNKLMAQITYAVGLGIFNEGQEAYASKCIKCGKCENHCPQELPIRDLLDDVSGEMEGVITKVVPPLFKAYLAIDGFLIGRKKMKLG